MMDLTRSTDRTVDLSSFTCQHLANVILVYSAADNQSWVTSPQNRCKSLLNNHLHFDCINSVKTFS